jgi:WD40 repeat protein
MNLLPRVWPLALLIICFVGTASRAQEAVEIRTEPIKLKAGDPLSARALVARPPAIRGAMSWSLETRRHRGAIFHVALSPDGKTLATGGIDGTIRLWDVETGKLDKCLLGHGSYIYRLAWSPDGNTLASAGAFDATARLWDVKTGMLLRTLRSEKGYVTIVAWSPEGKRLALASAESGYVIVFDAVRGEHIKTVGLGQPVAALGWAPDGLSVAYVGSATPVQIWELSAAKPSKTLDTSGDVSYSFSWSPDGKTIAVGGANAIRVYEFESGNVAQTIPGAAYAVAYSPDGATLASAASGGAVQLWEAASGMAIKTLAGSATNYVSWSRDGKRIGTTTSTTAAVWEVESAKVKQNFDACGIHPPVWSPGKPIVSDLWTASPSVYDANTGKRLAKLDGHKAAVSAVAWTKDGKTLASGSYDNTVKLWEIPSGQLIATLEGHTAPVHAVAWMADGKTLASGSSDKTIRVWKAPDKKPSSTKKVASDKASTKTEGNAAEAERKPAAESADKSASEKKPSDALLFEFKGHDGPVTHLAWAPTGKTLASGSADKTARLWNATSGKAITTMNVSWPVQALGWSPDGKTFGSSGVDDRLNFWNPTNGQLIRYLENPGSPPQVSSITWSPSGTMIASGRRNHTMQLWSGASDKPVQSLQAMAPVVSATWTQGGTTIAAGCEDRTVRFWDAETGKLRGSLIAEQGQVAAVSADGHFRAEPGIEADLFYVVQTNKTQETLTISDFAAKSKWKNIPAQATVMGK